LEIDDSVAHTGTRSLKVVGIIDTGDPLHVQVSHGSVPVENGKVFTVAFWAKVDAEDGQSREVNVSVRMEQDLWPGFQRSEAIVLDSTDWKEYTDTFVLPSDAAGNAWVGLAISQSDVNFWIDDFRFFEGGPTDEIKAAESAVSPVDKLPVSWGGIKDRY
jgi:hypothetical protein